MFQAFNFEEICYLICDNLNIIDLNPAYIMIREQNYRTNGLFSFNKRNNDTIFQI